VTVWKDLQRAVREATRLGAEFRIIGADLVIDRHPETLRARLDPELLCDYFGGTSQDNAALDFSDRLGIEAVLVQTREELRAAATELSGSQFIGIDIETWPRGTRPLPVRLNADGSVAAVQLKDDSRVGLDPHQADIACLQLYGGGNKAYVLRGEALQLLLGSTWLWDQHLVAHNASFEVAFLRRHARQPESGATRHPIECTMQAQGLLHGTHRRGLDDASKDAFGIEPPKELQLSCWGAPRLSAGQIAYASSDAVLAWRLWPLLREAMVQKGRGSAYQLQRDAIPAVADMGLRGLHINLAEHARQVEAWSVELADARREYLELTATPAPSKPAEVRDWISKVAGDRLDAWPRTTSGELSISATHVKRLALSDIPTAKPVLQILGKMKLLSSFGPKLATFVNPSTGRIHCSYNIAASKAGRFTASRPNLQQLPSTKAPEFKGCIVAAPGHVLVGGDWSQVELRAAAEISRDPALRRVFAEGRDLHDETAALISRIRVDEVTKAQRAAAKAVNFGSIYGAGPGTIATNAFADFGIDMSIAEAKAALDRFFQIYSQLKRWMRDHADACQRRGYVLIEGGRVVERGWEDSGELWYTQCCNLPIQGAAANAMLRALPLASKRLRDLRGGLVATVHDELIAEVDERDGEAARAILEETMIEAFAATFPSAPCDGVVKCWIGPTWLAARA
jgi:DNA polymerase I-like protein with 3'-5' exonuclease and polymerase domains